MTNEQARAKAHEGCALLDSWCREHGNGNQHSAVCGAHADLIVAHVSECDELRAEVERLKARLEVSESAPAVRKLHEAMRPYSRAVCSHPSKADNGYCHTCGERVFTPNYFESRGRPRSICELVDCRRQDTHTHEGKCEHPTPGDGSCDNCRCAETPKGEAP